jgi:hypothetical protein
MATTATTNCVRLYVADRYRSGCPSNSFGRRVGYGLTPAQAVSNCEPYANQAPWAPRRAREVLLVDGARQGEEEAWGLLGMPTGAETGEHLLAIRAAERQEWTICLRHAVAAGLIVAPAHRRPRLARFPLPPRYPGQDRRRGQADGRKRRAGDRPVDCQHRALTNHTPAPPTKNPSCLGWGHSRDRIPARHPNGCSGWI